MLDITLLREAIPYIKAFRGKTFVIKFGGEIADSPELLNNLAQDIVLLQLVGIKVIVVHGGGVQANQLLEELNHEVKFVNGRRITDEKTLEVAKMTYGGKINIEIVSALQKAGGRSVGISGADGGLLIAKKRDPQTILNRDTGQMETVDFGYVGDIVAVNDEVLRHLIAGDYIPVVACLAADLQGNVYNVNADTISREIAVKVQADKLISITNVRGVMRDLKDPDSLIPYLTVQEAEALIEQGIISKGMIPKIQNCIEAIRGGVKRTTLIDGTNPDSLLQEVFTQRGAGTMLADADETEAYEVGELSVNA